MKKKKELSVAVWAAIALGAVGIGVIVAFVAGFFLGHFTGHDKTTTVGSALTAPAELGGEETEAAPEETETSTESEGASTEGGSEASSKLAVEADPSGALAFTEKELTAKAGEVEIDFDNKSPVPHNVAIEAEDGKVIGETEVITEGADEATVSLEPGTYTFFCTIPGHRQAGMEGTLVVE